MHFKVMFSEYQKVSKKSQYMKMSVVEAVLDVKQIVRTGDKKGRQKHGQMEMSDLHLFTDRCPIFKQRVWNRVSRLCNLLATSHPMSLRIMQL